MELSDEILERLSDIVDVEKREILEEFLLSVKNPVVVEGVSDAKPLEYFGVENVIILNKGQSMLQTVEAIHENTHIIILTDFDQHGKELRKKLHHLFPHYGLLEDKRPRELFARLRLNHVEDLKSLI